MNECVSVGIPARAEHLIVVRLAASGICGRMGMAIEPMEDIKAAVEEACILLMGDGAGYARLAVSFEIGAALNVTVRGEGSGGAAGAGEIDAGLSLALLEALADGVETGPGFVSFSARGGAER